MRNNLFIIAFDFSINLFFRSRRRSPSTWTLCSSMLQIPRKLKRAMQHQYWKRSVHTSTARLDTKKRSQTEEQTRCTIMVRQYMYTVEHDFSGHEVNGINGVNGKKCYDRAFHLVNKLHDFTEMHDIWGNFCCNDFFRKTHARLYIVVKISYLKLIKVTLADRCMIQMILILLALWSTKDGW